MREINKDIELNSRQFENGNKLIGQIIQEVDFYLEETDMADMVLNNKKD